jgi:serine/threonine-protein kinase HipA
MLTTNIDLDEGTCSVDLLEAASEFFALTLAQARTVIKDIATVTATWRDAAKAVGARSAEIKRRLDSLFHWDCSFSRSDRSLYGFFLFARCASPESAR